MAFIQKMFQKILTFTRALLWTCWGAHSGPLQTPSWIDWPLAIKWQPTIELISPTIKNLNEIPEYMCDSVRYVFSFFKNFITVKVIVQICIQGCI